MVESTKMDDFIYEVLRGSKRAYEICEMLQKGLSFKGRIPKSFWLDSKLIYGGFFGLYNLRKFELREIRNEIIERILKEINEPSESKIYSDNYSRLLHVFAIFKISKSDDRIPATGENYMYDIAYELWALDDGTYQTFDYIASVTWFVAEAAKGRSFDHILPTRHTSF